MGRKGRLGVAPRPLRPIAKNQPTVTPVPVGGWAVTSNHAVGVNDLARCAVEPVELARDMPEGEGTR